MSIKKVGQDGEYHHSTFQKKIFIPYFFRLDHKEWINGELS